ncbi:hypothetical protein GCM10029992_42320 [Glycomyces albus]
MGVAVVAMDAGGEALEHRWTTLRTAFVPEQACRVPAEQQAVDGQAPPVLGGQDADVDDLPDPAAFGVEHRRAQQVTRSHGRLPADAIRTGGTAPRPDWRRRRPPRR